MSSLTLVGSKMQNSPLPDYTILEPCLGGWSIMSVQALESYTRVFVGANDLVNGVPVIDLAK
jgi:hypothetical protein